MGRNKDIRYEDGKFLSPTSIKQSIIRDSRQIEERADLILMLCGDEYYPNTSNQGIMAIIEDL